MMKLTANWRVVWWRKFSTWIAALNGLFVAYVFSQPILVVGLLGFAPDGWMIPLAVGAGFFAFVLPVIVTHISQPKLIEKVAEKELEEVFYRKIGNDYKPVSKAVLRAYLAA